MEPEVECRKSTQHDGYDIKLEHRDSQVLNSTTDALKCIPEDLNGCKDTYESVCFVLVLEGFAFYRGEVEEAIFYKVVNLVGVDGKAWIVWGIKHKATHVGEEGVRHGPFRIPEFMKRGHRVSGREILDLGERRKDLRKEDGEGNP